MILDFIPYILGGIGVTISVTAVALPMGFVIGLSLAIIRIFGGKFISFLITIYSSVMRGIPPIVLLFVLYFVIANIINLPAFWAGSIALGVISSGYQLEVFRGAVLSVSSGQMMASRALGLSKSQSVRYIILPQALRIAIPPWSNEAANVVKDSSLVYALGVPEILRRAEHVGSATHLPFIAFGVAAVLYFILVFTTNRVLDRIEQRTRIPGL